MSGEGAGVEEGIRRELERLRSEIEDLLSRNLDGYIPAVVFRPGKP